MGIQRRQVLASLIGAWMLPLANRADAEATVTRMLVGAPPGGGTDLVARALAVELAKKLSHSFVVENRPGAAGNIAAQTVARAAPDGGTLLLSYTSHVINASMYASLPFDPVKDFTPLCGIASAPYLLVSRPDLPANNISELIAYAKGHPDNLRLAIAGLGGANHLAGEMMKHEASLAIVSVPYKGTGPALSDTMAGHIDMVFAGEAAVKELVKAGKLKAIGVSSAQRLPSFPQVQAIGEVLPGFDYSSWYGLFGPAGMSPSDIHRYSQASLDALSTPEMRNRLNGEGLAIMGLGADQFGAFVTREIVRWRKVVQITGAKPE